MSRKHFSLLLAVTLVVALLVLLMPGKTGHESSLDKARLLPGLQEQVNDLDWLRVTGPGGDVVATMNRDDEYWRVAEVYDYPADWGRLRSLLADLAQAEVVEQKTDNPQYYDRLGVQDIDQPDAGGVLLEFDSASGLPGLIVGKRAQGLEGQYARLQNSAVSVLVDRILELPKDRASWLDRDVVNISDAEVVEIDIRQPDGEHVVARKTSADDENFELQDIPEGRKIRSAWTVNSLANALSSLTMEDVVPADTLEWKDATQFGLVTADGLRVDVELITVASKDGTDQNQDASSSGTDSGGQTWIRLTAGLYQTAVDLAVAQGEETAAEDSEAGQEPPVDESVTETPDAGERAGELNLRLAGWAYRIPQYKADAMNKRMEDLLLAESEPKD